jgi:hypothetical protein
LLSASNQSLIAASPSKSEFDRAFYHEHPGKNLKSKIALGSLRGIAGASDRLMRGDFARWRTEPLCFERFMFSASFFRVRMPDVCPGDLMMSSWPPSRTHRAPAETIRELSAGKTMATGISREHAVEGAQERMAAICDVKCADDR